MMFSRHRLARLHQPLMAHFPADGVEHGHTVCEDRGGNISYGPESTGTHDSVNIALTCPEGFTPWGLHHTHPHGQPVPSQPDIDETARLGVPRVCVTVPETGEGHCYLVQRRRRR